MKPSAIQYVKMTIEGEIQVVKNEFANLYYAIYDENDQMVVEPTKFLTENPYSYTDLKNQIILELHPFISNLTWRRPIVLPVIMEVRETTKED